MIGDLGFQFRPYYGFIYRRLLPTYNLYDSLNVLQVEVVQRNPHDWDACIYLLTTETTLAADLTLLTLKQSSLAVISNGVRHQLDYISAGYHTPISSQKTKHCAE